MRRSIYEDVNLQSYLLWLIREGRIKDWQSLLEEFQVRNAGRTSAMYLALDYLRSLQEAGLIAVEYLPDVNVPGGSRPRKIAMTESWPKIQTALGVSLQEMTRLGPTAFISTPYFGKPQPAEETVDLFVLMPFDAHLKPVYEDHITEVARKLVLRVARGDDFFTSHSVMSDIWTAITSARAVIADCTGRNPNVFYEIGLAHAVGKPVILITQNEDDVPFDIRHLRYIKYDYIPRGMRTFEDTLANTLRTVLDL